MQKSMTQVTQKSFFFVILAWFGGSGGSPEAAPKTVPKKAPKDQRSQSILGGYFGPVWIPNLIFVHFVCANFNVYFWHRFWEASGHNFKNFGVISGCLLESFWTLFRRCCKTQKMQPFQAKCLIWEVLGLTFCMIFANLSNVFFLLLPRRPCSSIVAELGLQRGSLFELILADSANFAWKKVCWNWSSKIDDFWRTFGRGRRRGAGPV